jgi:hypothetical protein
MLPALVYVLAAFAVVSGSYGAARALNALSMLGQEREVYLKLVTTNNEGLKPLVPKAGDLEKYDAREADALYGRRKATLPLAVVGLILSGLLFVGAMRAMRGDEWGRSAWTFAAAACIPYQLLRFALDAVMARDLGSAVAELPPIAQLGLGGGRMLVSIVGCGFAVLFYGVCVIYLRTPGVRRAFSDAAARRKPSA